MTGTDLLGMFALGLLGSLHCLGMCGAFVLCLQARPRQMAYQLGRAGMYTLLGAGVSLLGLSARVVWDVQGGRIMLVLAGAVMVLMGLNLMGVVPWRGAGPWSGLLLTALPRTAKGPGLLSALSLGFLTGLLPCGLLYAALARAAATPGPVWGGLAMLTFWSGTVPVLAGLGRLAPRLRGGMLAVSWPYVAGSLTVIIGCATALSALATSGGPVTGCH